MNSFSKIFNLKLGRSYLSIKTCYHINIIVIFKYFKYFMRYRRYPAIGYNRI